MFARHKLRELVHVFLDECLETEHHARAPLRIDPRPFGESLLRGLDGAAQFGAAGKGYARLNLARRRIEDFAETAGGAPHMPAADEVRKLSQCQAP